jgi:hypothetical protein
VLRKTRSPTSTPQACGLERWSRKLYRPRPSGRLNPSTRTISSVTLAATHAISSAPVGGCPIAARSRPCGEPTRRPTRSRWRVGRRLSRRSVEVR